MNRLINRNSLSTPPIQDHLTSNVIISNEESKFHPRTNNNQNIQTAIQHRPVVRFYGMDFPDIIDENFDGDRFHFINGYLIQLNQIEILCLLNSRAIKFK